MILAGVDVGGSKIAVGICDLSGNLIDFEKYANDTTLDAEMVTKQIVKSLDRLFKKNQILLDQVVAIGYGFPGQLSDDKNNVLLAPNNTCFVGYNAKELLHNEMHLKFGQNFRVSIDNDACVAAIAEAKKGAGRALKKFVYLTVSTDVGGALYDNGAVNNIEPGHNIFPDPRQPSLTLAQLSGGIALSETAKSVLQFILRERNGDVTLLPIQVVQRAKDIGKEIETFINEITPVDVSKIALCGDILCRSLIFDNARYVANSIVTLLNENADNEAIIIGGSVATQIPFYIDDVKTALNLLCQTNNFLPNSNVDEILLLAELSEERGIIGAALYSSFEQ